MTDYRYHIRTARADELPALREIERAAGALFHEAGLPAVAEMEAIPLVVLRSHQQQGLIWVAADEHDHPVGFALASIVDNRPHIEELSVHPAHSRRGLGTSLVEAVCDWAKIHGYSAVTLSTFRDVPWNAPFYARLGFRILDDSELSVELQEVREHERQMGLPVERRVLMRRAL